jgi:hypothetical protein
MIVEHSTLFQADLILRICLYGTANKFAILIEGVRKM